MTIELHPKADAGVAAQVEYYEDAQPGLGQRFYGQVIDCLNWIAANTTLPRLRKDYRRVISEYSPFGDLSNSHPSPRPSPR